MTPATGAVRRRLGPQRLDAACSHLLGRLPDMVAVGELRYVWQAGVEANELCGCGEPFDECPFWTAVGEEAFGGWDKVDVDEVLALEAAVLRHSRIPLLAAPRLLPATRPAARALRRDHPQPVLGDRHGGRRRRGGRLDQESAVRVLPAPLRRGRSAGRPPRARQPRRRVLVDEEGRAARGHHGRGPLPGVQPGLGGDPLDGVQPRVRAAAAAAHPHGADALRVAGQRSARTRSSARSTGSSSLRPEEALAQLDDGEVEVLAQHSIRGNPMRFAHGRQRVRVDDAWRTGMAKPDPACGHRGHLAAASDLRLPAPQRVRSAHELAPRQPRQRTRPVGAHAATRLAGLRALWPVAAVVAARVLDVHVADHRSAAARLDGAGPLEGAGAAAIRRSSC